MPSVNNYFDDKVTSIAFQTATKPATVGVMEINCFSLVTRRVAMWLWQPLDC